MYPATLWNQQSGSLVTGNTGDLPVAVNCELALDIDVTAVSGSVAFTLNRKGVDGVYYPIWTDTVSSTGKISQTFGAGLETAKSFGHTVQLAWVVTGTVTVSGSLLGK